MSPAYKEDPEKNRARANAWAAANREKSRTKSRAWRLANPGRARVGGLAWRAANREKARETRRVWREANPESHRVSQTKYAAAHKAKYAALCRKRQADQLQRTPVWADLKKIEKVYEESRMMTLMMDEPWHVDHVIPLRGRRVSGLHVHTNLQLLPGVENVRKNNRYELA